MTGISADLTRLTTLAEHATDAAARLRAGAEPGGGTALPALPQAARFLAALTAARSRQVSGAQDFARFYADAGTSLSGLGAALSDREEVAAGGFRSLAPPAPQSPPGSPGISVGVTS